SWSVLAVIEDENGWESGLFFLDESTGYLAMKDAKSAFRTTDGGATWTGMPATAIPRRILFADPEVGWAMRYNRLTYTTDGGKRWSSRDIQFPAMQNAFSLPRRDRAYAVGEHGMIYRYSVVAESTPVSAKVLVAPAMPGLDNAVLAQIAKLESSLQKIDSAVQAAGGGAVSETGPSSSAGSSGDWSSPAVDQQLAQMQATVETVASGVPAMGRKHRNLNLAMFGLKLLGDLTGQGGGLKQAFATLQQSKDAASASAALQSLHGQLDAMKMGVESFKAARRSGG
ncbi:MAG: WD40/YVTN/BNR-like repeat-containing protein, partial [Steroidobacteraceae bacterium]